MRSVDALLIGFVEGDFDRAIQAFSAFSPANEHYQEAQFYLGHSYFLSKRPTKAIAAFDTVLTEKMAVLPTSDVENAEWTRLLALLATGQTGTGFQSDLQRILDNRNHAFFAEAVKLEQELKSFWRFQH